MKRIDRKISIWANDLCGRMYQKYWDQNAYFASQFPRDMHSKLSLVRIIVRQELTDPRQSARS